MSFLEFLASVVDSLAWPGFIAVGAYLLRMPLFQILERMSSVRFAGLEADFREALADKSADKNNKETEEKINLNPLELDFLQKVAELSPRAAIIEAWMRVELASSDYVAAVGGDEKAVARGLTNLKQIQRRSIEAQMPRYMELRTLRNEAAHAAEFAVPTFYAEDYAKAALKLAAQIRKAIPSEPPKELE